VVHLGARPEEMIAQRKRLRQQFGPDLDRTASSIRRNG
jgi:hypothetical protein